MKKTILKVPRPQKHKKRIFYIKYSNLLAPQATPKENVNIVLNYPYKSMLYSKKDLSTGRVHARWWDECQIPCAATNIYIYIY